MDIFYYTNAGPVLPGNEDGIFLNGRAIMGDFDNAREARDPNRAGFFAVVDGMGGIQGGYVATTLILDTLKNTLHEPGCPQIEHAAAIAAKTLKETANSDPALAGMGAAIAGIWLAGDSAFVFNCGDCRIYEAKAKDLFNLGHDHSLVQHLVDMGLLAEDDMRRHPKKHVITSAISAAGVPEIFCRKIQVSYTSRFLVCSDGLWEAIPGQELAAIMAKPPADAAATLVELSRGAPVKDNFSFIILDC